MARTELTPISEGAATAWIAERARTIGFDLCGVVRAEKFPELSRTEEWLARGYAGEMKYLSDPRRTDPTRAMAGVRSVIVCALNYNTVAPRSIEAFQDQELEGAENDAAEERGWISRYAWGDDYHEVLQGKLRALAAALAERFTKPFEARIYSDTGPVNERVLAKHAGLGWIGKNTLLLNAKLGSWFFLGVILTTLDLEPTIGAGDGPPPDLCGSCTKCIEACPTDALIEPYLMDSRRCIAYLTIEHRGSIAEELREGMGRQVFGCDICQDVCPWNRRAPATSSPEFQPRRYPAGSRVEAASAVVVERGQASSARGERAPEEESLLLPRLEWLAALTEEEFRGYFRGSPIKRTKWRGLVRNVCIAMGNAWRERDERRETGNGQTGNQDGESAQRERTLKLLKRLAASPDFAIVESAQWALSRIE
jgi:epoxyqueuosine reductase